MLRWCRTTRYWSSPKCLSISDEDGVARSRCGDGKDVSGSTTGTDSAEEQVSTGISRSLKLANHWRLVHASWRNNCGYTPLAAVFKIQRIWDETVKTVNLTPEWLFFILYMFNKTGSINLCAFDYIRIVLSHMNVKSNFITNRIEKLGCI